MMYSPPPPPSQQLQPTFPCNMSLLKMQYHLEKNDVYHREEQNLQIYRNIWLNIPGPKSNFFYWLDYEDGQCTDLNACSRDQLDEERVTYVPDGQRKPYRVIFDNNGRLVFKRTGRPVNTRNHEDTIYVLSPKWKFYVADKINKIFHHSSFMSGGDVYCAGHLHVNNGWLESISRTSGHYRPQKENLDLVLQYLRNGNVDLRNVRIMQR